jgi:hypothetical protein
MEFDQVQQIYTKVCAGHERIFIDNSECYFKHHLYSDRVILKEKYKEGIEIAKRNGIKTEEDYIDFYIDKGWWSKSKQDEIRTLTAFVENLKKSKDKLILDSQKQEIQKTINEEEAKLNEILSEKRSIIPITAEEYADKYYNRFYLHYSLFKDAAFNVKFAKTDDYFVEIDDILYNDIWSKVFNIINLFKLQNIKYVAATGFFQNLLMLSGKEMSAMSFYGKPVVDLTINQADLFSYGASYRRSINNATEIIPDHILSDPENLISWCEGGANSTSQAKKILDRTPNKNKTKGERSGRISSIVGATPSDYKKLGIKQDASGSTDLLSEAKNSGGEMTINQVIKKTDSLK